MADLFKLGKLPARHDHRTLLLEKYLTAPIPYPSDCDWTKNVTDYGMMKNDTIGDCGIAGPAHMIQTMTNNIGNEFVIPDDIIVQIYSDISGYNPTTGENDNGVVLLDVLNYWRNTGFSGHKIGGYVKLNTSLLDSVKAAIFLFGGILTGMALPISAQGQSEWQMNGSGLSGNNAPYSWGGHCVPYEAYTDKDLTCVTWGDRKKAMIDWFTTYCDEAYAIFSTDFIKSDGESPSGFNKDQLIADLNSL